MVLYGYVNTVPFSSATVLAPENFFITRKAELGYSKALHSSTCSRIFSLWCNGRSVEKTKQNKKNRHQVRWSDVIETEMQRWSNKKRYKKKSAARNKAILFLYELKMHETKSQTQIKIHG